MFFWCRSTSQPLSLTGHIQDIPIAIAEMQIPNIYVPDQTIDHFSSSQSPVIYYLVYPVRCTNVYQGKREGIRFD